MNRDPEEFVNGRDQSWMRLVPAGKAIFGSTRAEIENAVRLDKDGELFSLENETPQFEAFLQSYYIGMYAVTNQQFAKFLMETRPPIGVLNVWLPWPGKIRVPTDDTEPYSVVPGLERHPIANVSWFWRDRLLYLGRTSFAHGVGMGESGSWHRWPYFSLG